MAYQSFKIAEVELSASITPAYLLSEIDNMKVGKRAKIKNRYNQAPHLTQDTNGKVTTSQLDITNESQEVIPFPCDHKANTAN